LNSVIAFGQQFVVKYSMLSCMHRRKVCSNIVQAAEIMKELMDNGPLQGKCISFVTIDKNAMRYIYVRSMADAMASLI